jgi:ribosome maturation factor RimP
MDQELVDLVASTITPLGLELVDLEIKAATVRVVVDGRAGADLDLIASATRALSTLFDRHDPIPGGRYTLEVSSPGIERPLRTPAHFARAVGETVSVRTRSGAEGERRVTGRLAEADDTGFVLEADDLPDGRRRLTYDEVERARTVFEWGATPPSGSTPRRPGSAAARSPRRRHTKKVTSR